MKEAFWGVLIIILGIFGIVCINLFQNVTVDNDKVYYVLKESTEASAHDSIDLSYYRLGGSLRIVEDKFVENLARRFSQSITAGNYTISVQNINELPPLMSVKVRSGVTSIKGDEFNLTNRVDAIIETKYKLSEVLDFLGITEEEWNEINNKNKDAIKDGVCGVTFINDNDLECITGDLKFDGLSDTDLKNAVCIGQQKTNVDATAKYSVCECGKWTQKEETLVANPVYVVNNGIGEYVYTYTLKKTGEIRNIDETITKRVRADICTTAIEVYVPKDLREKEPSSDNSKYVKCDPVSGIRIPEGVEVVLHPNYIPSNATNREIKWTPGNASLLSFSSFSVTQPRTITGFSKAVIKGKLSGTEEEKTTMTATTTLNQSAVCPIRVWDGNVDSVTCNNATVFEGAKVTIKSSYEPYNATKTAMKWTISDSSVAKINESTGAIEASKQGNATITIKAPNGKTATCTLSVIKNEVPSYGGDGGGMASFWYITDSKGKTTYYASEKAMLDAAPAKGNNFSFGHIDSSGAYEHGTGGNMSSSSNHSTAVLYDFIRGTITNSTASSSGYSSNTRPNSSSNKGNTVAKPSSSGSTYRPSVGTYRPSGGSSRPSSGSRPSTSPVYGRNYCFLSDELVLTNKGYKEISKIKVGDMVLSYNEQTKKNEYARVIYTYEHLNVNDNIYSIKVNNTVIEASTEHPFYVKSLDGFKIVRSKDLKVGDVLFDSNGNIYPITDITITNSINNLYNIEVENNHNYYVSNSNILVHNRK